jgi:hypothetical protein
MVRERCPASGVVLAAVVEHEDALHHRRQCRGNTFGLAEPILQHRHVIVTEPKLSGMTSRSESRQLRSTLARLTPRSGAGLSVFPELSSVRAGG